jgi:hypothetical protein
MNPIKELWGRFKAFLLLMCFLSFSNFFLCIDIKPKPGYNDDLIKEKDTQSKENEAS